MMNRSKRFWPFMKSKGFYIALALCIVGAGAAAWLTAQRTMNGIKNSVEENQQNTAGEEAQEWNYQEILEQQTSGETAAAKPSTGDSTSTAPESSSGTASAAADSSAQSGESTGLAAFSFSLPVKGTDVLAAFSGDKLVKNETLHVWRTHDGIDVAANKGDSVSAVSAGKVTEISEDPLWGGVIKVDHGAGYTSIYCGVKPETALKVGDSVTTGQVLGSVDQIPSEVSMASHLHFSVQKDSANIDPMSLLQMGS